MSVYVIENVPGASARYLAALAAANTDARDPQADRERLAHVEQARDDEGEGGN